MTLIYSKIGDEYIDLNLGDVFSSMIVFQNFLTTNFNKKKILHCYAIFKELVTGLFILHILKYSYLGDNNILCKSICITWCVFKSCDYFRHAKQYLCKDIQLYLTYALTKQSRILCYLWLLSIMYNMFLSLVVLKFVLLVCCSKDVTLVRGK